MLNNNLDDIRVQTMFLKHYLGKRQTDYQYFFDISHLSSTYPIQFSMMHDLVPTIYGHTFLILSFLMRRVPFLRGILYSKWWIEQRRLFPYSYRDGNADLIFTNLFFPRWESKVPIVLEADFFPYGVGKDRDEVKRLLHVSDDIISRASVICVRHELSFQAFSSVHPSHFHKVIILPFYMPYLDAIPMNQMEKKTSNALPMRLLFVGNDALRKGLPELVQAYNALSHEHQQQIELVIVSNFNDGPVSIPVDVKVYSNISRHEVVELMRKSHVFAMLTYREAYGKVYVEAMASGCALLCSKVSPQQELFGEFGDTVDLESQSSIIDSIIRMLEDVHFRTSCAFNAREYFVNNYHHDVVGAKYYSLFSSVVK